MVMLGLGTGKIAATRGLHARVLAGGREGGVGGRLCSSNVPLHDICRAF